MIYSDVYIAVIFIPIHTHTPARRSSTNFQLHSKYKLPALKF